MKITKTIKTYEIGTKAAIAMIAASCTSVAIVCATILYLVKG
jgi:hypothetical protein